MEPDENDDEYEEMTPDQKAQLEKLHAEFARGLAGDGEIWPVYRGDGE